MKLGSISAFVSIVGIVASLRAAAADDPPPVTLTLRFTTMADFDPEMPEGKIVCLAKNNTDKPVTLPAEYDGGEIVLYGSGLSLHPARSREAEPADRRTVVVKPGEEALLFELPLAEILDPRESIAAASPTWYWTWQKRPAPPHSPIHKLRNGGYAPTAQFFVQLRQGELDFRSEPVTLKVKSPTGR